jgi:TRAP-type C4-dicarboxylate transport system permease small subunit
VWYLFAAVYSILKKIATVLEKLIIAFDIVAMAALVLLICAQVVSRYIFNSSLTWSEELSKYITCYIIFLTTGYALGTKQHVNIDIVMNLFPPKAKFLLNRCFILPYMFFSYICIRHGYSFVKLGVNCTGSALPWLHLDWVYFSIPLSGALMMFYSLLLLFEREEPVE